MKVTYDPLYTCKPVGKNIWIVDGEAIRFYGMPFPTRMTVVRLRDGSLWIHSPIHLTEGLRTELDELGEVKYLISPNKIHYWYIQEFQKAYPDAISYSSPGVVERARSFDLKMEFEKELGSGELPWEGEIDQVLLEGSRYLPEWVFFHRESRSLIVTDIIENFESHKIPVWFRPLAWLGGALAPKGGTTRDQWMLYLGREDLVQPVVQQMIDWKPERILLAHGKWIEENVEEELYRIFAWSGIKKS